MLWPTSRLLTSALLGLTIAVGCPAAPTEAPPSTEPAVAQSSPEPAPPIRAPGIRIEQALQDIQKKRLCNRVMGCPPATILLQAGASAIPFILTRLKTGNPDAPWYVALIDLLGNLEDTRALPFLRSRLEDRRWLVRSRCAIALGRLQDEGARAMLMKIVESPTLEVASVASAAYALVRLGDVHHTDTLLGFATEDAIRSQNWGWSEIVLELATDLRLQRAAPGFRLACQHRDFFLRRTAVRGIRRIRDTGGLACLIDRLADPIPSLRREAHGALQQLTGEDLPLESAPWEAWCARTGCRPQPNPENPQ